MPELNAAAFDCDFALLPIELDGGSWSLDASDEDAIQMIASGFDGVDGSSSFALRDGDIGCILQVDKRVPLDLSLRYEDDRLSATFGKASEIRFDPTGNIEAKGTPSAYTLEILSNDGYAPTDWYRMRASGTAGEVTLRKADGGYLLSGDTLTDVTLFAESDDADPRLTFSTDAGEVFLYEIDEDTIGVSVDQDGDGTYETRIAQTSPRAVGDIDGSGTVDILDAIAINKSLLGGLTLKKSAKTASDVDGNGTIDTTDALNILKAVVKLVTLPVKS